MIIDVILFLMTETTYFFSLRAIEFYDVSWMSHFDD